MGLSVRATTRVLTPATLENPIFFHNTNASSAGIRAAVDQMADVGFEMMILSFGSEFDLESTNQTYIQQMHDDIAYAASNGIEVGGYDLIVWTRDPGEWWDAVDPATNSTHGDACAASGWIDQLTSLATGFVAATGLAGIETDGPYPGYVCASTNHSHHSGLADSVYQQTLLQGELFRRLRAMNVYIHQPDAYYFQGGAKSTMGYNENQFSLPRWTDLHVSRMTVFDDTYLKLPTQGWMFVPAYGLSCRRRCGRVRSDESELGGVRVGAGSNIWVWGVAACYRGYRLFDSEEARAVVIKWVGILQATPCHTDIGPAAPSTAGHAGHRLCHARELQAPRARPCHGVQPHSAHAQPHAGAAAVLHRPAQYGAGAGTGRSGGRRRAAVPCWTGCTRSTSTSACNRAASPGSSSQSHKQRQRRLTRRATCCHCRYSSHGPTQSPALSETRRMSKK